jgi:hypothetical protein
MSRRSSRIRVDFAEATLLKEMLGEYRHRLIIRRADAKDRGEDLAEYQMRIGTVNRFQNEVERALADMEWTP